MNKTKLVLVIIFCTAIITLLLLLALKLPILEIASYYIMFTGVYVFFVSYLKRFKVGIIVGSILFQAGSIVFINSKYELLNIGNVFTPIILVIIGSSVLLGNLLFRYELILVVFSILSMFAGIWMIVMKSEINFSLFLSASYSIIKSFWLVAMGIVIIIFSIIRFRKRV